MPGVPSGRGCEACRKQKKKCDQNKPSCSRCTRLQIACKGCGQRRYKFVENQSVSLKSASLTRAVRQSPAFTIHGISRAPSSQMTMMTGALCSALEIKDVRYDLSVYGLFFEDIPRRLGTNSALDASANALTAAFASVHSRRQPPNVLESYVQALKALRVSLNDPKEVGSANTLCAIYLMMICQGWIGEHDDCTGHGQAIAHLLYNAASRGWKDSFGANLVITLCVVVIFESLCNPNIRLDPWLGKLTEAHDKSITIGSLKLGNLAKLPDFIRHPELHLSEIKLTYQRMATDVPEVQRNLSNVSQQADTLRTLHARCQAAYGIVLTFAIILNTILRCFEADDIHLVEDSAMLADEVIILAEDASQYRPLGSSSMPLCLVSAWAATNDTSKRAKLEEILAEYQSDFAIARWMEIASWLEVYLKKHRLTQLIPHEDVFEMSTEANEDAGQFIDGNPIDL